MQESLFERLQCQSKNMGESIAIFTDSVTDAVAMRIIFQSMH